jgi:hypothetical protein
MFRGVDQYGDSDWIRTNNLQGAVTLLHSSAPWVLVSGRDHGLGHAQGAGLAAFEHTGRQLLR